MPWLLGWRLARSTGLEEKETSRCELPAPTQGRLRGTAGAGRGSCHPYKRIHATPPRTQNYGFSFSWIPRFFKECYLWVWPFVGSRIIFQCISDPLVAFTQQNKMLRTLWVLGSKLNSVPQLLSLTYFISTMGKIHIMNCELKWNNDPHWQVLLLLSPPTPAWGTQEGWPSN